MHTCVEGIHSISGFIREGNKYLYGYCNKQIKLSPGGMSPMEYRRKLEYAV